MALVYQETRAEAVCSLEQDVLVLLNDKSRMKGDLHVRFREKFEVKVLLLTRLRGRRLITVSYSIFFSTDQTAGFLQDNRLFLLPEKRKVYNGCQEGDGQK